MSTHIEYLSIEPYVYVTLGPGDGSGALYIEDDGGDTLLFPYPGRFTWLEDIESGGEAAAEEAARVWERQR